MIKRRGRFEIISVYLSILGFISLVAVPIFVWVYLWSKPLLLRILVSIAGTMLVLIVLFCIARFFDDGDALEIQEREIRGEV
jgi:hypothetical protein